MHGGYVGDMHAPDDQRTADVATVLAIVNTAMVNPLCIWYVNPHYLAHASRQLQQGACQQEVCVATWVHAHEGDGFWSRDDGP